MESMGGVIELVPGELYALGGLIELDGSVTWAPSHVRGYQPVNCYLALEGDQSTLIDTGLAIQEDVILRQLREVLPQPPQLLVVLTRAEYECMGNLGAVIRAMSITDLYTGGTNNPFDGPDDADSPRGKWNNLVKLGTIPPAEPRRVGRSSRLEVHSAPVRILPTHWLYASVAECLFTSDLFGHTVLEDPSEPRVISSVSSAWKPEPGLVAVKEHLLAKFGWLGMADQAATIIENLDTFFGRHQVTIIAPTHGCILVGRDVVEHHYQLVRRALVEIAGRSRPASRSVELGSGAPAARATCVAIPPAGALASSNRPRKLPREIAPNVFWLGTCISRFTFDIADERFHSHLSSFLVRGPAQSVMIDTGLPSTWDDIEAQLDDVLAGRPLDWIFPSHAESPHSSSVGKLLEKFPRARVIGDVRDYHFVFPGSRGRLVAAGPGDRLDLGDGHVLEFVSAFLKDLPGTLWGYERKQGVLFVSDGFGLGHRQPTASVHDSDLPVHTSGECVLTLSELRHPLHVDQAYNATLGALHWTRFVDSQPVFEELQRFLVDHPTRIIAPAHGYIIDGADLIDAVLPLVREAHDRAFNGESAAAQKH